MLIWLARGYGPSAVSYQRRVRRSWTASQTTADYCGLKALLRDKLVLASLCRQMCVACWRRSRDGLLSIPSLTRRGAPAGLAALCCNMPLARCRRDDTLQLADGMVSARSRYHHHRLVIRRTISSPSSLPRLPSYRSALCLLRCCSLAACAAATNKNMPTFLCLASTATATHRPACDISHCRTRHACPRIAACSCQNSTFARQDRPTELGPS